MVVLPPPQFDHAYAGPVIEQIMPASEVAKYCSNERADACTLFYPNFAGDKCYIVLPQLGRGGVTPETQTLLRRHEIGHCNGWRH